MLLEGPQCLGGREAVPCRLALPGAGDLALRDPGDGLVTRQFRPLLVVVNVYVDADLWPQSCGYILFCPVGSIGDPSLRQPALQRLDRSAAVLYLRQDGRCTRIDLVGQVLDEVGPAERVCGLRDAGLKRDDLLGPQRERDSLLARDLMRFVIAH